MFETNVTMSVFKGLGRTILFATHFSALLAMSQSQSVYSRIRVFLYSLCMAAQVSSGNNLRQKIMSDIFTNYDGKIPPNYESDFPVTSYVQIYVISVDSISEASMDFSMSFFLRQRWHDNRLNYTPEINMSRLELDTRLMADVWVPDLYILNEKKAGVHDVTVPNKLMHIYPDGLVVYSMRVTATFACHMDLQKYPMDSQICRVIMESYGLSTETLSLRWNPVPYEISDKFTLPQFELDNVTEYICDVSYAGVTYTCIGLEIRLTRSSGYYVIQVYVPSCLIVILSWVSFWLNIDATPARISLGLLTVLTMTTQSTGAKASLPRVSYVKAIDVWMSMCLLFVFAALIEFAWVNVLARVEQRRGRPESCDMTDKTKSEEEEKKKVFCLGNLDSREKARLVDKISRILFPVIFTIFNLVYWIYYSLWDPVE